MGRAWAEDEILNFVSKKLATAQLPQLRNQSAPLKRLPTAPTRSSSRITKPSSRNVSPKLHDKSQNSASTIQHLFADSSNPSHATSMSRSRNQASTRLERPLTWHSTTHDNQQPMLVPNSSDYAMNQNNGSFRWPSSSYDWPGDVNVYETGAFYSMMHPNGACQPQQSYSTGPQTGLELSASSYFPRSQSTENSTLALNTNLNSTTGANNFTGAIAAHSNVIYNHSNNQLVQFSDSSTTGPYSLTQPSQTLQPQNNPKAKKHRQKKSTGEELVGLGLYNKTQEVPKALCAGLPATFVPNGSYGTVENNQNSADAWSQVPDWQYSDSPEGSEASHSPFDNVCQQEAMTIQPGLLPSYNPFLFSNDGTWYPEELKQVPQSGNNVDGYQWFDPPNYTSYV